MSNSGYSSWHLLRQIRFPHVKTDGTYQRQATERKEEACQRFNAVAVSVGSMQVPVEIRYCIQRKIGRYRERTCIMKQMAQRFQLLIELGNQLVFHKTPQSDLDGQRVSAVTSVCKE